MKIKKIACSHTRQVIAYTPASFSIEAEIGENEDPEQQAKVLQELVIKVLYRDDVKQRDHLINSLVYPGGKPNNVGFGIPQETPRFEKEPVKLPSEMRSNKAQEADEDDLPF